jgi:hypothetical protein
VKAAHPLLIVLASCLIPHVVSAGPNSDGKILLHVTAPTAKNSCALIAGVDCSEVVAKGDLYPYAYFAYVLIANGDSTAGVAGVQFGVEYAPANATGIDVYSWHLCGDLQFPSETWPESGSGNVVTWDPVENCQRNEPGGANTGVIAIAGYFYCSAYSTDEMRLTRRASDSKATIGSCDAIVDVVDSPEVTFDPSHLGYAVFSPGANSNGYNPCGQ